MKHILAVLAAAVVLEQHAAALELGEVSLAAIRTVEIPLARAPRAGAALSVYRSFMAFATKAGAVNAMMNAEGRLLRADVAVFEKRVLPASGGSYSFEITFLSPGSLQEYSSEESFSSAVLALNTAMNSEASMLKASVPVAETGVVSRENGFYGYKMTFLSRSSVKTFSPQRTFSTAAGAVTEMYNSEARLIAGKVGVAEKRITTAGGQYSFEISYVRAGE